MNFDKDELIGKKIEQKLNELRELCQSGLSKETIHVSFNLNSYGWNTEIQERTAKSLKDEGISMKNIKGEWIK
jgi:hypothetical protein